jgi:hypothetical protein
MQCIAEGMRRRQGFDAEGGKCADCQDNRQIAAGMGDTALKAWPY